MGLLWKTDADNDAADLARRQAQAPVDIAKAQAEASRDIAIAQSNAQVTIAQTQAATMQLGILKSSQDAQFQTLAWLTERLDANDTKMQIAVENAKIAFQQESDRHVERMQQLKLDERQQEIDAADRQKAGQVSTDMFLS
jgi:hypothetical protein